MMKSITKNNQSVEDLSEVIDLQHEVANSPQSIEALMSLVCERSQTLARATGATVEMHEGDEMIYRACAGTLMSSLGLRLNAHASLSGLCVQTGEVLYCEDSEADPRVNREACRRVGARSMICVPLRHHQQNIGVLKVVSPVEKAFTEREISLLRLIAGVLSSSLSQMISRQSLADSEIKFRTLIETAADGILVSENGVSFESNPAFLSMFGYEPKDILGRSILDYVSPELKYRTEEHVRVGYALPYETICRRKDGSTFHAEVYGRSVELAGKKVRVTTVRDITERKLIDATLRESEHRARQADHAKSRFLANMSHEIRTPLNGIIGMTQLISDTQLTEEQKDLVETIRISSDTLLTLVNDILDLSKIEAQEMTIESIAFDVNKVVEDVHKTMSFAAKVKGLEFRRMLAPNLGCDLKGDPTRVRQVLLNLVNNAIKFTSQGAVEIHTLVLNAGLTSIKFRVEIHDTGIGIKPDALARLFKPFSQADASTTREYGGTGLGLSISKSLINAMGGQIGVIEKIPQGSIFWFELELDIENAHKDMRSSSAKIESLASGALADFRILVAEDNSINAKVVSAMLSRMGYNSLLVGNGAEALDALRTQPFDLVLMDCQMPEMDGYEATRKIRAADQSWNKIPVIAQTANAMKDDLDLCMAAGMNDYITKPINYDVMQEVLQRWVSNRQSKGVS